MTDSLATIPVRFVERARQVLADQCTRSGRPGRAESYLAGSNDDQPELVVVARLLRDMAPRPLYELLAEDEARKKQD